MRARRRGRPRGPARGGALGRARGLAEETAASYGNLAYQMWFREGPAKALETWRQMEELAGRHGYVTQVQWARMGQLETLFDLGEWDRVLDIAREMEAWDLPLERRSQVGVYAHLFEAWVRLRRGQRRRARRPRRGSRRRRPADRAARVPLPRPDPLVRGAAAPRGHVGGARRARRVHGGHGRGAVVPDRSCCRWSCARSSRWAGSTRPWPMMPPASRGPHVAAPALAHDRARP